jgi:carboxymethylenebutenolidase
MDYKPKKHPGGAPMIEKQVEIPTKAGAVDTFLCRPERGGPCPAVIFYMDAPGIREELRDMARRLATVGYYVLLPNMYYRRTREELPPGSLVPDSPERARMWELMQSLSNRLVVEDTEGLLAFIDAQKEVRRGPVGCVGYCMSGQYVVSVAGHFPDRIAAGASFYGVGIATDKPDSPHLLASKIRGELYLAFAEIDRYVPAEAIATTREALAAADCRFEIEMYPGTEHGFAFPQRHCYDKRAAERHWERLLALYRRRLG